MSRLLLILVLMFIVAPAVGDDFPDIRNTQAAGEHPPSPTEMLDLFELPPGFKVTLFAGEPDVQQPIAFDFDDLGRIWVAENYTYSARGKVDQQMRDRVIILHDKDGDGQHDERKVFWDKGRMLTGLTWGYGGLWILNDGTLSFIPDKDGDDVPDSEPIPMLNGWTKNAGHNVVNGLLWGPDGWLYGRHGITDTSYPGTIDTPKEERAPMNCGIWRFHPVKHTFEIVCHGTTNPWGLDYNEVGDMFMSNNVIGHLWHVIPGAHYQRMFGQDFNPHCYELMGPISDHYHWDESGKWSQSRDGAADDLGGGHSHCGLMLYYGQNFPKEYWGKAFMCNTHGRCVNVDRIERKGSSYVAKHEPNFLKVNTPWFRGVEIKYGPAGCVYLSDWSDNGECHDHDGVHRTSGRIYRISYGEVSADQDKALRKKSVGELISVTHSSSTVFRRRRALRLLFETISEFARETSHSPLSDNFWRDIGLEDHQVPSAKEWPTMWGDFPASEQDELAALAILGWSEALNKDAVQRFLFSRYESVQAAAVGAILANPKTLVQFREELHGVLRSNDSSIVALAFASSTESLLKSLEGRSAMELIRAEDPAWGCSSQILIDLTTNTRTSRLIETDKALLLTTWYAAMNHRVAANICAAAESISLSEMAYRFRFDWMDLEDEESVGLTLSVLAARHNVNSQRLKRQLEAILTSIRGRDAAKPRDWENIADSYRQLGDPEINQLTSELGAVFGSKTSLAELSEIIKNRKEDAATRSRLIRHLRSTPKPESVPVLLSLLNDKAVYVDICKALVAFDDDPRIPKELIKRWNSLRHGAKEAAADTLCSRKSYAVEFTKAIADGRVDSSILTAVQVRQLNTFNDESITEIVNKHWGVINETPEALEASIAKWKLNLSDNVLSNADLGNGAALFKKSCATCHKLYGEGGKIGPDLTGGNRANMDYLLSNIINPSGEVPKQYTVSIVELKSGRLITGVVVGETEQVFNIQTDKELRSIAKSDIEQRTRTSKSLMPNGLLDALKPDEVRDLIAFLRNRQ